MRWYLQLYLVQCLLMRLVAFRHLRISEGDSGCVSYLLTQIPVEMPPPNFVWSNSHTMQSIYLKYRVHWLLVYLHICAAITTTTLEHFHHLKRNPYPGVASALLYIFLPSCRLHLPSLFSVANYAHLPAAGSCDWNSLNFSANNQLSSPPSKVFVSLGVEAAATANARAHHFALCGHSYGSFIHNHSCTA